STGFGAEISAARARMLACEGSITRIVIGPEGQPLEEGRTKRVYPPHLRRAVEARDHHCVFAGCDAPSYWCDVHHLLHWAHGGDTDLDNAALLCERHHSKVHSGFTVQRHPDGRWRTRRPDGTEILLAERLALAR
ncbi:MAG: endonuclease, partial [Blastococcus sp.]|nr:endonuclease [Blastococcus sp.]